MANLWMAMDPPCFMILCSHSHNHPNSWRLHCLQHWYAENTIHFKWANHIQMLTLRIKLESCFSSQTLCMSQRLSLKVLIQAVPCWWEASFLTVAFPGFSASLATASRTPGFQAFSTQSSALSHRRCWAASTLIWLQKLCLGLARGSLCSSTAKAWCEEHCESVSGYLLRHHMQTFCLFLKHDRCDKSLQLATPLKSLQGLRTQILFLLLHVSHGCHFPLRLATRSTRL